MNLALLSEITTPTTRQRIEGKASKDIEGLKRSILHVGLLQPIVLTENKTLVAGERRLLAIRELYEEKLTFSHNGETVPEGQIPYTNFRDASELLLSEAEFDENFWRQNLSWQEQAIAQARIHELRLKANPNQTLQQTAVEILERKGASVTPEATNAMVFQISKHKKLADNMHLPVVANAQSETKAYQALLDDQKRKLERDLILLNPKASPHELILGDYRVLCETLPAGGFDLILTDPPYGINVHTSGSTSLAHSYDDTPTYALDLYRTILRSGFHLLKPMGAIFMFCDIEHFVAIRTMAEQQAFSTFRTPIVWVKGTEGHAPWGREGPKRTYEILLYAVKGQRSLALPFGPDIINIPRSTVDPTRVHAAEKPTELFRFLVQKSCRAGDRILDPCCGSGVIFTAVEGLGIQATGIELSPEYHTLAASRLARLAAGTEQPPDTGVAHPETAQEILAKFIGA